MVKKAKPPVERQKPNWKEIVTRNPVNPFEKSVDEKTFEQNVELLWNMTRPGWHVWLLGQPNPSEQGRRPRYFLGKINGTREEAVVQARDLWPQNAGRMLLTEFKGTPSFRS